MFYIFVLTMFLFGLVGGYEIVIVLVILLLIFCLIKSIYKSENKEIPVILQWFFPLLIIENLAFILSQKVYTEFAIRDFPVAIALPLSFLGTYIIWNQKFKQGKWQNIISYAISCVDKKQLTYLRVFILSLAFYISILLIWFFGKQYNFGNSWLEFAKEILFYVNIILIVSMFLYFAFTKKVIFKKSGESKETIFRKKRKKTYYFIIVLLIIVSVATFFRVYQISDLPFSGDEGLYPLLMDGIEETGMPKFVETGLIYTRSYLYTYFMFGVHLLFGTTHFSMRILSVIFGVVLVLLFSLVFKKDRLIAILSVLFITMQPYVIIWSRSSRFYMFGMLLLFLVSIIFYKVIHKDYTWARIFLLGIIILIAATNFDFIFFLLPAIGVYYFIINRGKDLFHNKKYIFLYLICVFSIFINKLFHGYFYSHSVDNFIPKSKIAYGFFHDYWKYALDYYNYTVIGSVIVLLIAALILSVILVFKTKKIIRVNMSRKILYISTIFVTQYFLSIIYVARIQPKYALMLYVLVGILLIYYLRELLMNLRLRKCTINAVLILLVVLNVFCARIPIDYKSGDNFHTISYLELWRYFFTNQYTFHSISAVIRSPRYLEGIEYIEARERPGDIYINTDIYNTYYYKEYDYILNSYMSDYMAYKEEDQRLSVYTGTPFIYRENQLRKLMQSKKQNQTIWILADMKLFQHNNEIAEIILNNFELEFESNNDFIGLNYGYDDASVRVFSFQ